MATGLYAIHPLTGREVPIMVANFVLMDYGTGAVMCVPAHDERDFAFAKKFDMPIIPVIKPLDAELPEVMEEAFAGEGIVVKRGKKNFRKVVVK